MESVFDITLASDESYENDLLRYCHENERLKLELQRLKQKLKRYTDFVNPDETKNCLFDRLRSEVERLNNAVANYKKEASKANDDLRKVYKCNTDLRVRVRVLEARAELQSKSAARYEDGQKKFDSVVKHNGDLLAENCVLHARLDKLEQLNLDQMNAELSRIKPELEQYRHYFGNMFYVLKQVKTH